MKRSIGSSDSLGALKSICPNSEEQSPRNINHVYGREFQSMFDGLDEDACVEESGGQKKRRLSVDQVKALENLVSNQDKLLFGFTTAVHSGRPSNWKETTVFLEPTTIHSRAITTLSNITMKPYSKRVQRGAGASSQGSSERHRVKRKRVKKKRD